MSREDPPAAPGKPTRSFWAALRDDETFRATFLVGFVIPAALMLGTIGWVVRAMVAR